MFGLIVGIIIAVAGIGYVAYKWPAWFGKTVDKLGDDVTDVVNPPSANTP